MDDVNFVWQIGIIALVAGAMIGALAYRLFAPSVKQVDKIKSELDTAREELSCYKASVNSHFNKASELVNDLTQNYVKVYRHLAEGAQNLGDSSTLTNLLEQHQGKVLISVDDETNARDTIAGGGFVDSTVTQETPVEAVDEHAEPFVGTSNDEIDPVISGDDLATTNASKSAAVLALQKHPLSNNDFVRAEWKNRFQPIFFPAAQEAIHQLVRDARVGFKRHDRLILHG